MVRECNEASALFDYLYPRRLVSKGRIEQAQHSLSRLRNRSVDDLAISEEIVSLRSTNSNDSKGDWRGLFDSKNRVRTHSDLLIAIEKNLTIPDSDWDCYSCHVLPADHGASVPNPV